MSIDRNVYVGPVVRCVYGRRKIDPLNDEDGVGFMDIPPNSSTPRGEHVYFVNIMLPPRPRMFFLDEEVEHFEPMPASQRDVDIGWMEDRFRDDIQRFRELYGDQNVTLDWGVFGWTS